MYEFNLKIQKANIRKLKTKNFANMRHLKCLIHTRSQSEVIEQGQGKYLGNGEMKEEGRSVEEQERGKEERMEGWRRVLGADRVLTGCVQLRFVPQ